MALAGKNAAIKIDTNTIAEINDASISINGELLDVTAFDNNSGFRRRLPNLVDATVNISGFYDATDTNGQAALRGAILAGTLIEDVIVLADASSATSGFTGNFYVESFEISPSVGDAVPVSITLQSDGAIAVSS